MTMLIVADITFWKNNGFNLTFQNASTAWLLDGTNLRVYGGGTFNATGDSELQIQ